MIRIIHVSDLHFHESNAENKLAIDLLSAVCAKYSFMPGGTNFLLVTGDTIDDGTSSQRSRALHALEPFEGSLLICPGNHCYGPVGNIYDPECAADFDKFTAQLGMRHAFKSKKICIQKLSDGADSELLTIGLNSVLETKTPLDFARGGIGNSQLEELDKTLNDPAYKNLKKLVYLHHRPEHCSWFLELTDSSELMSILNNRVDIICFGHSGGSKKDQEPPQARLMTAAKRKYGVPYLLNANTSKDIQKFYEITINGQNVKVELKSAS